MAYLAQVATTPGRYIRGVATREGDARVVSDNLKVLLGALGGTVLVLLLAGGFSGSGMGYGMMGGMGWMMGGGMMGGGMFGALISLLFWALLLAPIVALVVWIIGQTQRR
jgi:hypothetical protein